MIDPIGSLIARYSRPMIHKLGQRLDELLGVERLRQARARPVFGGQRLGFIAGEKHERNVAGAQFRRDRSAELAVEVKVEQGGIEHRLARETERRLEAGEWPHHRTATLLEDR